MNTPQVNPLTSSPKAQRRGRQRTQLTPEQLDALHVLDVVETAALLRVGTDLIRREIRSGTLSAENYGSAGRPVYRIHRVQLDAWRATRSTAQAVK